ncbi:hypothetical protein DM860_016186 [Cuscuta australis]|uniref:HAT C-terminal dimerisation domain-containing protein n=1 Tax=Cuscuta australis TaxID=267555 RepID=A0A328DQP0_9ASTE|nr:hypothetical protein DM860_016186 [Cuscuta australis]
MNLVKKMVQPEELATTGAVPLFWPYRLHYLTKSRAVCWAGFVSSGATISLDGFLLDPSPSLVAKYGVTKFLILATAGGPRLNRRRSTVSHRRSTVWLTVVVCFNVSLPLAHRPGHGTGAVSSPEPVPAVPSTVTVTGDDQPVLGTGTGTASTSTMSGSQFSSPTPPVPVSVPVPLPGYGTVQEETAPPPPPKSKKGFAGIVGGLLAKKGKRAQSSTSSSGTTVSSHNELAMYQGVPCDYDDDDGDFDVLGWWKRSEHMFPCLGMLARQVLSVLVSTIAVEREFSAGGNILTDYRSCLNAESLETLVCNHDWLLARRRAQESSYQLESEHYMNATTDGSPSSEE